MTEKILKHELYKHGSYLISLKESGSAFVNIDDEIKKLEELFQLASKKDQPAAFTSEEAMWEYKYNELKALYEQMCQANEDLIQKNNKLKADHQPTFEVGEYYSFTTYRKDYDADTTFIIKVLEIKGCGIRVIEYDIHGRELGEYVYDADSDFLKEAKPATAEQIAEFKKAEYFSSKGRKLNEFDYGDKVHVPAVASGIIKSIDKGSVCIVELADGTEIHFDGSRYEELALLKTAEELREVGEQFF